jgi:hypothetical protein
MLFFIKYKNKISNKKLFLNEKNYNHIFFYYISLIKNFKKK